MKPRSLAGLKLPEIQRMSLADYKALGLTGLVAGNSAGARQRQPLRLEMQSGFQKNSTQLPAVAGKPTSKGKVSSKPSGKPAEKSTSQQRMSASDYRDYVAGATTKGVRHGKPNKMGAIKVYTEDEGVFDSKEEYRRFLALKMLLAGGVISDLRRQVKYSLDAGGIHISDYVADFVYVSEGQTIVEDSKGFKTATYLQKRRLMLEIHGIAILETGRSCSKPARAKRPKKVNSE